MTLVLITPPTAEPVTADEVKAHCNIESTADDVLLNGYIAAARRVGENLTKRQFVSATYELVLDRFPGWTGAIELPMPPLQSVTSVKYIDEDGVEQTLSTDLYTVDTDSEPGRIYPVYDEEWPDTRGQRQAVRIRYVTGWPVETSGPTTPENIRTWVMIRVAGWYESREPIIVGTSIAELPRDYIDGLLDEWRIPTI